MKIRELNDFTHDELIKAFHNNMAFWGVCKEIADEYDTVWALDDLLRDCPSCVEFNIGYPGDYMYIRGYDISYASDAAVLEWVKKIAEDFDNGIYDLVDFEKAEKYLSVLRDYTVMPKENDEEYMEKYVDKQVRAGLDAVLSRAVAINNQFYDDYYLSDCLLSCELLDEYYEKNGAIFHREYDRKIA